MADSILDNILVPKHIILSEAEAKEVLEKLKVKPYQLPKIFISDPAIKALNQKVKVGDIVKIIRSSPTAGESIAYRVVVE